MDTDTLTWTLLTHKSVSQLTAQCTYFHDYCQKTVPWMFKNAHSKIYPAFRFHLDPHHQPLLLFGEQAVLGKLSNPRSAKMLRTRTTWYQFPWCCKIWASVPGDWRGWNTLLRPAAPAGHGHPAPINHPDGKGTFMSTTYFRKHLRKSFGFSSKNMIPPRLPHLVWSTAPEVSGKKCN